MISKCQRKRSLLQRKYLKSQGIPWLSCYSWEQRKLGDLGSVSMCRRIFKHQTSESGEIPFFKIGTFGGEPDAFITRELFEEFKAKYPYPDKGDILISASGSIGRTVEFTGENEYFQDSNIVWLKHDKSIINPFLRHLYSVVEWAGIEGSTIKRLYNDNILKTEVMLPSVQEQTKIAEMLDGIDSLITLHQRQRKNSMRNCSCLPFSWEQRKLSELAEIVGGGTPDTNNSAYWDGDIDWYAPAEMEGQRYAVSSVRKITELGLQKSSAKMLPAHRTVLFTSRAGIGKMAILQRPAATNQGFQSLVLRDGIDPYFIYSMGDKIKGIAEGVASGSTFLEISGKMLGSLEVMTPSIEEQKEIASFFRGIDDLITLHQREQIFINLEVHDVRSGKKHRFIL